MDNNKKTVWDLSNVNNENDLLITSWTLLSILHGTFGFLVCYEWKTILNHINKMYTTTKLKLITFNSKASKQVVALMINLALLPKTTII